MLFDKQVARKPNIYPWTQEFIDKIWGGFWTPNEFDFKSDYAQFKSSMTEHEQQIIVRTLSAIGQIEIAVKRFWAQLGDNLPHPSMYDLGYVMANTEVIHNQAYEKLLETLHLSDIFEKNLAEPVISRRVDYLRKYLHKVYTDDKKQYIYAIILFTLFVENVSLFSQFYVVLWFNRFKNMLKDTAQQVQYTKNEEGLHAQIGIKLINTLRNEYPQYFDDELTDRVIEECNVAFKAESALIDWMLGDYNHPNLNTDLLKTYVQGRLNQSLIDIGIVPQFNVDEELTKAALWMEEEVFGDAITDFFHKRPVNYAKNNRAFSTGDLF